MIFSMHGAEIYILKTKQNIGSCWIKDLQEPQRKGPTSLCRFLFPWCSKSPFLSPQYNSTTQSKPSSYESSGFHSFVYVPITYFLCLLEFENCLFISLLFHWEYSSFSNWLLRALYICRVLYCVWHIAFKYFFPGIQI